jgi:hypothetical protein
MKNVNQDVKELKFKILYNTNKKKLKNAHSYELNNREILKSLYLISFEENVQNNSLNRTSLNLLNLLSLKINKYTNNLITHNHIFKRTYNNTISLTLLYKIYKLRKLR